MQLQLCYSHGTLIAVINRPSLLSCSDRPPSAQLPLPAQMSSRPFMAHAGPLFRRLGDSWLLDKGGVSELGLTPRSLTVGQLFIYSCYLQFAVLPVHSAAASAAVLHLMMAKICPGAHNVRFLWNAFHLNQTIQVDYLFKVFVVTNTNLIVF